MTSTNKSVLYIGGHGKIGLLSTPKLVSAGYAVRSLVRKEEYFDELRKLGAEPVLGDITSLTQADWQKLFDGVDVVVWGAGNGGRGGAELTTAVDRDGALTVIDALEALAASDCAVPKLVMISYIGATQNSPSLEGNSWDAYVSAKKTVDARLSISSLDYLILGPSALTEEPAGGVKVVPDEASGAKDTHTSRELVADVITEVVSRDSFPESPLAFIDGSDSVSSI